MTRRYHVTVRRVWTLVEKAVVQIDARSKREAMRLAREAVIDCNEDTFEDWGPAGTSWDPRKVRAESVKPGDEE